jgi:hypothetical protein
MTLTVVEQSGTKKIHRNVTVLHEKRAPVIVILFVNMVVATLTPAGSGERNELAVPGQAADERGRTLFR